MSRLPREHNLIYLDVRKKERPSAAAAAALRWGAEEDEVVVRSEGPFDLIVCADCCYYGEVLHQVFAISASRILAFSSARLFRFYRS